MAEHLDRDKEDWLKEIMARHIGSPTSEAVDAILLDMATDQTHMGYAAIVREFYARNGILKRFETFVKQERVAVISYSGDVLSVPANYGLRVPRDPANPNGGETHQLGLWGTYCLKQLDDLIDTLGAKRDVLSTRVAFFANLRRRWAEECPEIGTAGEACQHLGLKAI